MYFPECERLAAEQPGLAEDIIRVDSVLHDVQESGGVLRIADVASKLRVRESIVSGIFAELGRAGLLRKENYVECPECGALEDPEEYQTAVDDEDAYECSRCGHDLTKDKPPLVDAYRVGASAVRPSRPENAEGSTIEQTGITAGLHETLPDWVTTEPFRHTPLLDYYSKDKNLASAAPFAGKRVLLILHFLRDLLPFVEAAKRLGLDMRNACFFYKEYFYPQRDAIADWLRDGGATVLSMASLSVHLRQFAEDPTEHIGQLVVIEDGGHIVPKLHNQFPALLERTLGAVEQTTRGIMNAEGVTNLRLPVVAVAKSRIKNEIEPEYVAEAVFRNVRRMLPNLPLQGRKVGVLGYGAIGEKIVDWLKRYHAIPTVFDPNAEKIAKARTEGCECADSPVHAVQGKSLVIGTSGRPSVTSDVISRLDHGTHIVSASSELYEIDIDELHQQAQREQPLMADDGRTLIGTTFTLPLDGRAVHVLANGYPVNFWGLESMPGPIADLILTLILLSAAELASRRVATVGVDSDVVNSIADRCGVARKFNEFQRRS